MIKEYNQSLENVEGKPNLLSPTEWDNMKKFLVKRESNFDTARVIEFPSISEENGESVVPQFTTKEKVGLVNYGKRMFDMGLLGEGDMSPHPEGRKILEEIVGADAVKATETMVFEAAKP